MALQFGSRLTSGLPGGQNSFVFGLQVKSEILVGWLQEAVAGKHVCEPSPVQSQPQ